MVKYKKMQKKRLGLLVFACFAALNVLFGQELNCNVTVVTDQLTTTDKRIYDNMREEITDFMRTTKWTDEEFLPFEKIECNLYITISERVSTDKFKATMQVQSVRPVFETSYNSTIFNFLDKDFVFEYIEFQPITYTPSTFTSNLSSVLAFYAYTIIGLDFDTYSKSGGTKYFQKAQDIVNQAQGKDYVGWESNSTKKNNRYWLVTQYLQSSFQPLRICMYNYHRLGMDNMSKKKEASRKVISESLLLLKDVNKDEQNSFWLQLFFTAKRDEIIKIYSDAAPAEITDLKSLVNELDASNSSKYTDKLK
jgi:hypothetical protein